MEFWHAEYADSLYLRNLRDLRGKDRVFWHAEYAEYADCFCFCGICEICVEKIRCFGTQNTQIVLRIERKGHTRLHGPCSWVQFPLLQLLKPTRASPKPK